MNDLLQRIEEEPDLIEDQEIMNDGVEFNDASSDNLGYDDVGQSARRQCDISENIHTNESDVRLSEYENNLIEIGLCVWCCLLIADGTKKLTSTWKIFVRYMKA